MRFDILTLFPGLFDSVFRESIVGRAQAEGLVEIHVRNTLGTLWTDTMRWRTPLMINWLTTIIFKVSGTNGILVTMDGKLQPKIAETILRM